jgi:hypothetical protein
MWDFQREGMSLAEAAKKTILYCLEHDILKEFLKEHGSEVTNMLITEWNWDVAKEVWQEEARDEGIGIGEHQEREKWQSVVAEKDTALAEKDAENERLRKLLAELQGK